MSKIELKLRRRHPRKSFRLGKHIVGVSFQEFDLSEKEKKELEQKGPKHWLISKEEFEKSKKKPAKEKKREETKK